MAELETIEGLTKRTESLESIMKQVSQTLTTVSTTLDMMPKKMMTVLGAASGDPKAFEKFFDSFDKMQKSVLSKENFDKFGGNFERILNYLETMQKDEEFNRKRQDILRKSYKNKEKLESGKEGIMAVMDKMSMDNPFWNKLFSRTKVHGSLDELKRLESINEQATQGAQNKNITEFTDRFLKNNPVDIPKEEEKPAPPEKPEKEDTRKKLPPNEYYEKQQRKKNQRGGGSQIFDIMKYGVGREEVTSAEVAKLPFALSAPPLLLHHDIRDVIDMMKEMKEQAEWDALGRRGGKGDPLSSALEGIITGITSKLIPSLGKVAKAVGAVGLAVGTVGGIIEIFKNKSGLGGMGGSLLGGILETFGIASASDTEAAYEKVNMAGDEVFDKLSDFFSFGLAKAEKTRKEGLFINGRHAGEYQKLQKEGKKEKEARDIILKKYNFDYLFSNKAFDDKTFSKNLEDRSIQNKKDYNKTGIMSDYNDPINIKGLETKGMKFHTGGVLPGMKELPFTGLPGEVVLSPYESQDFKRGIQDLVDKASGATTPINTKELEKEIKELITLQKELIQITKEGNGILNKNESKPKEESSKSIPPASKNKVG